MAKNKVIAIVLILIGAALLLGAVTFWIDTFTLSEPAWSGVSLRDWLTTITGLVTCIIGVMEYFKKDKKAAKAGINVNGGSPQIATGEYVKNIQGMNIEKQVIVYPDNKSLLNSLHQLPPPMADFTGREKEIGEITKELQRGVTISGLRGMGGVGKTALGVVIAHQLKDQYPDGQIFLDLRGAHEQQPLTTSEAIRYVLRSFEPEAKLPDDEATLTTLYNSVLQGKKVFLFFDNAHGTEQVR